MCRGAVCACVSACIVCTASQQRPPRSIPPSVPPSPAKFSGLDGEVVLRKTACKREGYGQQLMATSTAFKTCQCCPVAYWQPTPMLIEARGV